MELLSPAGSLEALMAAVDSGADAVYIGGTRFNARINAKNFTDEELNLALAYAKPRKVKVFVVLNTLIADRELEAALYYAKYLYEMGVDAIIIQDIGLISLIKEAMPSFELHASTQMGICNVDGVRFCEDMGLSRVVLAREVSLDGIAHIKAHTHIELEAFAHGAMCVSFSGACLFSSMVGGRSGNRGLCAQPCRKPMDFTCGSGAYRLSMADMCMIEHVNELKTAGISSIKLEGRMKSSTYVATVTSAYRHALDGASQDELMQSKRAMFDAFNRGNFTSGYYFGDGAITNRRAQKAADADFTAPESRRVAVDMELSAHVGENASLKISRGDISVSVCGAQVQQAACPRDDDYFKRQLVKLGSTPFVARNVALDTDRDAFIGVGAINELRRNAVNALIQKSIARRDPVEIAQSLQPKPKAQACSSPKAIAKVYSLSCVRAACEAGADEVVYSPEDYLHIDYSALKACVSHGAKLLLSLPVALLGRDANEDAIKAALASGIFDGVEVNNLGQIGFGDGEANKAIGGAYMNVFNSESLNALKRCGLARVRLSNELNHAQSRDIARCGGAELQVHGRIALMQLFHCTLKESGCKSCEGDPPPLFDENGRCFPIKRQGERGSCLLSLYNCDVFDIVDKLPIDDGFDAFFLDFAFEDETAIRERMGALFKALSGERVEPLAKITRGRFNKKID